MKWIVHVTEKLILGMLWMDQNGVFLQSWWTLDPCGTNAICRVIKAKNRDNHRQIENIKSNIENEKIKMESFYIDAGPWVELTLFVLS